MKPSYSELLKDPRWQRRRLEVFERAGFTCEDCDAADKTLHAHHCLYRPNCDPWDYPLDELRCLCEVCHDLRGPEEKDLVTEFKRFLATVKRGEFGEVMGHIQSSKEEGKWSG